MHMSLTFLVSGQAQHALHFGGGFVASPATTGADADGEGVELEAPMMITV